MGLYDNLALDFSNKGQVYGLRVQYGPSFRLPTRPRKRLAVFVCVLCGQADVRDTGSVKTSLGKGCYSCALSANGKALAQSGKQGNLTHGMSKFPEYRIWGAMKDRCCCENNSAYPMYGGRGITVCNRWLNSFPNFYEDMGVRPSKNHSIDRIDNDGPYAPDNCRWATKKEQANNRRPRGAASKR